MAVAAWSSRQIVQVGTWPVERANSVRSATTASVCANSIGSGNVPVHGWQRLDGSSVRQMKALQTRYHSPIQRRERQYVWRCSAVTINHQTQGTTAPAVPRTAPRTNIRLALPSKGRMAEETLELLDDCQLTVRKVNPRQYVADIDQLEHVEVWFQRASDVVRKIKSGDVDIGIVGYDMVQEYGEGDDDLVIVHDALGFGGCHLAVAVPNYGEFGNVSSLEELAAMPQWTEENPLRVVTGYTYLGQKFLTEKGFKHFTILTADGALEAAPAMGTADVILDLVSSGTTLRENNLRELAGGKVLASEGVLVANRRSLLEREGVIQAIKDILERLEAHLRAADKFSVVANVRAESEEDVAVKIHQHTDFPGLQGPTISPVYTYDSASGKACHNFYAITIIVPKPRLYDAVQQLRAIGGSGVLVSPLVYIFDEEPPRWRRLLKELGLESKY